MDEISADFNFLFNNLNKISYILKDSTHFGSVNKKMADFCALDVSELEDKSISVILDQEKIPAVKKFNQEIFQKGLRKNVEMEIEINNEQKIVKVDTIPHYNSESEVDYLLCLAEDITAEIEKERKFYRNKKRSKLIINIIENLLQISFYLI